MSKQHRITQVRGQRTLSAAKIASDTTSTYGGVSESSSSATSAGLGNSRNFETTPAPPVSRDDKNSPVTFGHLQNSWKVLWVVFALISSIAGGVWWLSNMSSKVENHEEDIRESKGKTEKLINDSAVASAKLQKLDSQVGKLEDKIFEQALARSKK